jgi:hypothetical protein
MRRQVKSKPVEPEPTPVVAVITEPVVEKPKQKKVKKPVESVAPVEPAAHVEPAAPAPVPVTTELAAIAVASESDAVAEHITTDDVAELATQYGEFMTKLNQLSTLFAAVKSDFRVLEKKWSRELKSAQKSQSKRKRKSGNRQPSGFVKPTKISDELAKFLEKPLGSEMARTDVTREINKYIRLHDLQDKANGRKINFDAKLQTLLKLTPGDDLTYFNLQRYMSHHFEKKNKETKELVQA